MNTPYPELFTDDDARRAALAEYNAGIERSQRDYRVNPIASCGVTDCDRLRTYGAMCSNHAGPKTRPTP